MTPAELIGLVRTLIGEVTRFQAEYEKVSGALAKLRVEHQAVKDELARLKKLPPRPPQKPSGMDKATDRPDSQANAPKGGRSTQRRGSNLDKLTVTQTIEVKVDAPAGSRHKGYEEIVVQDLVLNPLVTRYRRERWQTPDGKTLIAPLDPGIVGGYGPHLQRLILMLHFQGQMTCERILALLNGVGVVISKRQVVRLLAARLETFRAEDAEVLKTGLSSASFVTVDDTGARHRGKSGVTTQIGSDSFTTFRTGPSKSRLAFLRNLLGGAASYVVNEAALVYMRACNLSLSLIDTLAGHPTRLFASHEDWTSHLNALGFADLRITPDPVRVASEGALWGAVREQGLLGQAIVVSDGAGQFRVGEHALCWVHAERLVHKLIPANDKQRNAIEVARRMIWWFYRALKEYKLAPSLEKAERLRAQTASSTAPEPATPPSTACSGASFASRTISCASSTIPIFRCTPTPRKTTSASSSPSAKSPAGPSATEAATPATSCSGSPRPAGSSKSPSSTISALASPFQAPKSPISQLSSGPPQANAARKFAPVTRFANQRHHQRGD